MKIDDISARRILLRASGLKKGHVLDVGIGGCACMARFLAQRGFDVVGVDHSTQAVHEARKEGRGGYRGRFEARLADAERLPFRDGEFDVVFSYHTMHHAKNIKRVMREMFRVCKAGGKMLVADMNERGRRKYKHFLDAGILLQRVERCLRNLGLKIRKIEAKYDTLFVCQKVVRKCKA